MKALKEKLMNYYKKTSGKVTDMPEGKEDAIDRIENLAWKKFQKLRIAKYLTPVLSVMGFAVITAAIADGGRCVVPVWHKERPMPRAMQQFLPPDAQ